MTRLAYKIYLKAMDETKIVARLDSAMDNSNQLVTEVDRDTAPFAPDIRHYLVGEIADRLYAYEQLGYSPEELKKIVKEHEDLNVVAKACNEAVENMRRRVYITIGRQNGRSMLDTYRIQTMLYGCLNEDIEPVPLTIPGRINRMFGLPDNVDFLIETVIFNEPATIVFWKDGTKTVVKATNEEFDPEKGLAMAIAKKALGNKHDYYNVFKKWLKKYEKECKARTEKMRGFIDRVVLKKEDEV